MIICEYGCGKEAKYQLKNKKWCCSKHTSQCLYIKSKNNKHLKGIKTQTRSDETKLKISIALKGRKHSIEQNEKKSEMMKQYWNNKKIFIPLDDYPLCECGCGNQVSKPYNRFILGHHTRVIDCAWHRGLTKENHPGLQKLSNKLKGRTKETHDGIKSQSEKMKYKIPWIKDKKHSEESKNKMSHSIKKLNLVPWNKGLDKNSSKRIFEMSKKISGENSPVWKGGISCEPYCEQWKDQEYKESIKERDGYKCLNPECNKTSHRLCVHHIDYIKKNCHPLNLITVCTSCNMKANFNREWHKSWYQAIIFRRSYYERRKEIC